MTVGKRIRSLARIPSRLHSATIARTGTKKLLTSDLAVLAPRGPHSRQVTSKRSRSAFAPLICVVLVTIPSPKFKDSDLPAHESSLQIESPQREIVLPCAS